MPQPQPFSRGFAELVLTVDDVRKAARFYNDVVGLIPHTKPDDEWAWFWAGAPGVSQRVALHKGPLLFEEHSPLAPGARWGRVHYAFVVDRADLEKAADHVRAAGVDVFGPVRHEWMRAVSYYFFDPAGNQLEWWSQDPDEQAGRGGG